MPHQLRSPNVTPRTNSGFILLHTVLSTIPGGPHGEPRNFVRERLETLNHALLACRDAATGPLNPRKQKFPGILFWTQNHPV